MSTILPLKQKSGPPAHFLLSDINEKYKQWEYLVQGMGLPSQPLEKPYLG